jgi:fatty acid desaturase
MQNMILTENEKKNGRQFFIFKLFFAYILCFFLIAIICYCHQTSFLITCIASCALGMLFGHMTGLQHEAAHGILVSRKANYLVGVLLGIPVNISFTYYKLDHMKHHLFLGTPKNNEIFVSRDVTGLNLATLLKNIFMLTHHQDMLRNFLHAWFANKKLQIGTPIQTKQAITEFKLISLFILTICFLSCFYKSNLIFYLWVIPVCFIGLPIRSLIEIAEHFGCDTTKL